LTVRGLGRFADTAREHVGEAFLAVGATIQHLFNVEDGTAASLSQFGTSVGYTYDLVKEFFVSDEFLVTDVFASVSTAGVNTEEICGLRCRVCV